MAKLLIEIDLEEEPEKLTLSECCYLLSAAFWEGKGCSFKATVTNDQGEVIRESE